MSSSAALSSAEAHNWHLGAICLFWEHFIAYFPAAPHFNPQSTTIKVWPFQRRLGRAKIEGGEETREDSGNADTEAEEKTPSTSDTSSGSSQSHDADLCRCYLGHCMHVIQLHIALLTAAGYNNVTAENWQKHFHDELEARREDWPTVQSILDSEEQQRREAEEDDLSIATVKSRKRKAAAALAATDDSHNPVYSMHYHSLSPEVKAALLYLNTCWMLHDHNIHAMIAESQLRDTPASAYGQDDADRQYWLFTHCDWGEKRVHLYRETDAHNEQEYRWEVLASNRDQLEEALAVLMVQTSANSRTLVYRIQYEALEYMDREGRLAERRQRRAARNDIDMHNIIAVDSDGDGGGGRVRRARKQVNYAELENGDVDRIAEEEEDAAKSLASEMADRKRNSGGSGRRGRASKQQQQLDEEWSEEGAEEELYATQTAQPDQVQGTADDSRLAEQEEDVEIEQSDTSEQQLQQQTDEGNNSEEQQPEQQTPQLQDYRQSHAEHGGTDLPSATSEQTENGSADENQLMSNASASTDSSETRESTTTADITDTSALPQTDVAPS